MEQRSHADPGSADLEITFHRSAGFLCGRYVIWEPSEVLGEPFASAIVCPISAEGAYCYFRNPPVFVR